MNDIRLMTISSDEVLLSQTELSARLKLPAGVLCDETESAVAEIRKRAEIKAVYCEEDFTLLPNGTLDLGFCRVKSRALARHLAGCTRVLLFAATVGMGVERYLTGLSALSVSKRYFADAVSSAMIEDACNLLQAKIALQYGKLTPRFSPGYGDLPLSVQPALLARLDAARRVGITLSPSLLMTPKKSVTALIGVKHHD